MDDRANEGGSNEGEWRDEKAKFRSLFRKLAPAMFLGSLDQTIVATALPAMAMSLGNFVHIAWVVSAYLLAATIAAPVYGRVGDAIGRRKAMMWALGFFVAGSVACTVAPNFASLIAGRVIQGLGGGGLMTLAQALIGETVSPRERGKFQAWFSGTFALASTIGPLAGGFLSDTMGWRSIFWVNIALGGVAAYTASRVLAAPGHGRMRIDMPGMVLVTASASMLLFALSLGVSIGWATVPVIVFAGLSVTGFVTLFFVEARSTDPLIPVELLKESAVWRCSLAVLLSSAILFSVVIQLPLFLQLVVAFSPTKAGLMLIPLMLSQVTMALVVGNFVSRGGHTGKFMAIGFAISAVGFVALAAVLDRSLWLLSGASCLIGLGVGATGPISQTIVQWAGGMARLGRATGLMSLSRSIGGLLGTALASALLIAAFQLLAPGLTMEIEHALSTSTASPSLAAGSALDASAAFRVVFLALGGICVLAALLTATIPDIDLRSSPPNEHEA